MEQALVRKLASGTLDAYREAARDKGRSLEAELRDVIERNRPLRKKNAEQLGALSKRLRATRLPDGPGGEDSTPIIRWDRDTDHGRQLDDGWADDAGG